MLLPNLVFVGVGYVQYAKMKYLRYKKIEYHLFLNPVAAPLESHLVYGLEKSFEIAEKIAAADNNS